MTKYDPAFKRSVVEAYVAEGGGAETIGRRFGIDASTVRKWLASFAEHGAAGLAKKYARYDGAFKLSVLRRIWEDGLSYRQAAAIFDIRNASCLADWERRYARDGIEGLEPRPPGRRRSMRQKPPMRPDPTKPDAARSREELLAELAYLRMENDYLKKLEALTQARQTPTRRAPSKR